MRVAELPVKQDEMVHLVTGTASPQLCSVSEALANNRVQSLLADEGGVLVRVWPFAHGVLPQVVPVHTEWLLKNGPHELHVMQDNQWVHASLFLEQQQASATANSEPEYTMEMV